VTVLIIIMCLWAIAGSANFLNKGGGEIKH
jgi:hypothetical protein